MELRRYKDILALKTEDNRYIGFHAYNLDLAALTPELWQEMAPIDATTSHIPSVSTFSANALVDELEEWHNEKNSETTEILEENRFTYFSINIAQICNLKCTYCAAGGDGTYGSRKVKPDLKITFEQLKWLLSQIPEHGSFDIRFLGGEPLLYPSVIREIANYARLLVAGRDVHLNFLITTNGTLITSDVAGLLADLNAQVTISLDGPPEINDLVRPSKNKQSSTQLTLNGVNELRRVRSQLGGLSVNAVFGEHNLEVLKCYQYLISLGLDWDQIGLSYSISPRDEVHSRIYLEEMQKVAQFAYNNGGFAEFARITQFRVPLSRIEAKTRVHSYCGAGRSLLQSDTRGDLYGCNWFMSDASERIGQGVNLNEENRGRYDHDHIDIHNCNSCWARHLCGGGCMAENKFKNGSLHAKDKSFCLRQRTLTAEAIKYYYAELTEGEQHEEH